MAECTQGNLQCSKTGGVSNDDSESLIETMTGFGNFMDVSGALLMATILAIALVADAIWISVIGGVFLGLGILSISNSFVEISERK